MDPDPISSLLTLRGKEVVTDEDLREIEYYEEHITKIVPLWKKMFVNGEENYVFTCTLPREEGDIPWIPNIQGHGLWRSDGR
jgi:hypothetical protein